MEFQIACDAGRHWQRDDYFGASLASFARLFERFGYRLVCCNSHTGCNAFFVDTTFPDRFQDVPADRRAPYVEARLWLPKKTGHPASIKTIKRVLANDPSARAAADVAGPRPGAQPA